MTKAMRGMVHLTILVVAIIFQSFLVVALLGGEARETKKEVNGIGGKRYTDTRFEVHSPVGGFLGSGRDFFTARDAENAAVEKFWSSTLGVVFCSVMLMGWIEKLGWSRKDPPEFLDES